MARTPLLSRLQALSRLAGSTPETTDFHQALALQRSRRDVLKAAGIAGVVLAGGGLPKFAEAAPSGGSGSIGVAVIGAGLAGLSCAYELKKSGVSATVFEASTRLGGRCFSNRSTFPGQIAENGGELIDGYHVETLRLAKELGLQVDDLLAYDKAQGGEDIYFFAGQRYGVEEAFADFQTIQAQLASEVKAAPFPTLWNSYTARGQVLDKMSITEWINRYVPGGNASRLGRLLDVAYEIEYGAACSEQSALNLIYLLGYSSKQKLEMFGESDERYHIRGGNDQLVSGMASRLSEGQINLGHELTRISLNPDTSYSLDFNTSKGPRQVIAQRVVMAIPFSILRSSVDYSAAGFDARKCLAIGSMPMGNSSKFQLQFRQRIWRQQNSNGSSYSDTGYQDTWEVTRGQAGSEGILNNFTGGATAVAMNNASLDIKAGQFLGQLERVLPGITNEWNGRAILNYWPGYRWTKGAYGYYAPGNYTAFVGYEGTRQGNCHFCGEHTSIESQGYLNGAVETGQRCATEILADLKVVRIA
ncbi:NAD(P)/FAD-dependent oxidoreductase [Pseudomonas sp. BN515]|uniref:flavin monoamine oxidase family protein n=1 Tax=Pseudomonas sp. BN515 TaxID=2567892 RepID=UPI002457594F|nr:NAD(P)/FAD-dependent oxidoreductase [Pseudomonas sp. BN515]MDH4873516.1 FAD-dependent oxidoreductase [Pseudomonas sp. BN515]